jgi:hypothetical protein
MLVGYDKVIINGPETRMPKNLHNLRDLVLGKLRGNIPKHEFSLLTDKSYISLVFGPKYESLIAIIQWDDSDMPIKAVRDAELGKQSNEV